jgi:hypothetical protein
VVSTFCKLFRDLIRFTNIIEIHLFKDTTMGILNVYTCTRYLEYKIGGSKQCLLNLGNNSTVFAHPSRSG